MESAALAPVPIAIDVSLLCKLSATAPLPIATVLSPRAVAPPIAVEKLGSVLVPITYYHTQLKHFAFLLVYNHRKV